MKCFRFNQGICAILFLISQFYLSYALWDWLLGSDKIESTKHEDSDKGSTAGNLVTVPFELKSADEKFLMEAEKFGLQLSDLDVCHHQVIMKLKHSCSKLNEEDIGKLSVHLLNCQASVEGRPTFSCTDDMNLRECTRKMDQNTWNSYLIVSNRARAVCYTARQQEFTAKTEMTVNKLVWTAGHQLEVMQKLETGQNKVNDLTTQTLDKMAAGQKELIDRHDRLKTSQQHIQTFVASNLRELTKEKSLIAAGQKELAEMVENIRKTLDKASHQLKSSEQDRKKSHAEILHDLLVIQEKSKEMWNKIDNSTDIILEQQNEAAYKYNETLENLQKINYTVSYLLKLLDQTRQEFDEKLGWLTSVMNGAGLQLNVIYILLLHGAYLLLVAIIAVFLQAPCFARVLILVIIPLNALMHLNQGQYLDLEVLSVILATVILANWMISTVVKIVKKLPPGHNSLSANGEIPQLTYQSQSELSQPHMYNISSEDENDSHVSSSTHKNKEIRHRHRPPSRNSVIDPHVSSMPDEFSENLEMDNHFQVGTSDVSSFPNTGDIYISTGHRCKLGSSTPKTPNSSYILPPHIKMSPFMPTQEEVEGVRRELFLNDDASSRRSSSRMSTPVLSSSRSSTPSKRLCSGFNKLGFRCRKICISGEEFCRHHLK